MNLIDSEKHKGLRKKLVEKLSSMGIKSKNVLEAISKVPRHYFLDSTFESHAYQNKAFPIDNDQTISQPYTVALQSEILNVKNGEKILEIGTGSGYQTAILFHLGAKVYSIERQHNLFTKTKKILKDMRIKASLYYSDGYLGLPNKAPFDKIIITAGCPEIPKRLFEQTKLGGLILIPLGIGKQIMTLFIKTAENNYQKIEYENFNKNYFQFVPMLKHKK